MAFLNKMKYESCKRKKWINLTKSKFITSVTRNIAKAKSWKNIFTIYIEKGVMISKVH